MVYLIEKCQGQTRIDMTDLSLADKNEFSQNFQMTMVSLTATFGFLSDTLVGRLVSKKNETKKQA